jgi:opacity protein-like surface antigen
MPSSSFHASPPGPFASVWARARFVLLLVVLVATAAVSRADSPFARPGGYATAGIGGAFETFHGDLDPRGHDVSNAFLVGGRVGSRLNRFASLDLGFDYTVVGFELSNDAARSIDAQTLLGFTNLKLYPFGGRLQPFAVGGAGFVWANLACTDTSGAAMDCSGAGFEDREIAFAGRFGGGLDVYLTRHVALSGELAYVMPTGDLSDMSFLTFGAHVVLRF